MERGRPMTINFHTARSVSPLEKKAKFIDTRGLITVMIMLHIIANLRYIMRFINNNIHIFFVQVRLWLLDLKLHQWRKWVLDTWLSFQSTWLSHLYSMHCSSILYWESSCWSKQTLNIDFLDDMCQHWSCPGFPSALYYILRSWYTIKSILFARGMHLYAQVSIMASCVAWLEISSCQS